MPLPAPIAAVTQQAGLAARSAGQTAAIYTSLALAGLIGLGFLLAAAFIWLAAATNAMIAALIMGGTLLALSGVCASILFYRAREKRRLRRTTAANTALLASSISIADAGLRIASRAKGPMFWPAAATLLATWFLTRSGKSEH